MQSWYKSEVGSHGEVTKEFYLKSYMTLQYLRKLIENCNERHFSVPFITFIVDIFSSVASGRNERQ